MAFLTTVNLKLSLHRDDTVATVHTRVLELMRLVSEERLSTVGHRESMRGDTLVNSILLIYRYMQNMQRINSLLRSVRPNGIDIRTLVEVLLLVHFPLVVVAFTDRSIPRTRRSNHRKSLITDTDTVDTVATRCRYILILHIRVLRDRVTTPFQTLTRMDSCRVMLVERNTLRQIRRYNRVTIVLNRSEGIYHNR